MHLATNILEVDVNAVGAQLLQSCSQVLARLVIEGSIVAKLLCKQFHLQHQPSKLAAQRRLLSTVEAAAECADHSPKVAATACCAAFHAVTAATTVNMVTTVARIHLSTWSSLPQFVY